jgi:hypothetical protein
MQTVLIIGQNMQAFCTSRLLIKPSTFERDIRLSTSYILPQDFNYFCH